VCTNYNAKKKEARIKMQDKQLIFGMVPRESIRPTDLGPILIPEKDNYICTEMNWGWTVPWDKAPLVNAKSETLTTLTTFKKELGNRCLLLADGFYEKGILFRQPGGELFCMAGLWRAEKNILSASTRERNKGEVSKTGRCYVMLTTVPNDTVRPFHHRMPFIVRPDNYADWLGKDWERVLAEPDKSDLEKFQKQPELF
jgi:putative SOS response-associated peptidase YedK